MVMWRCCCEDLEDWAAMRAARRCAERGDVEEELNSELNNLCCSKCQGRVSVAVSCLVCCAEFSFVRCAEMRRARRWSRVAGRRGHAGGRRGSVLEVNSRKWYGLEL